MRVITVLPCPWMLLRLGMYSMHPSSIAASVSIVLFVLISITIAW